MQKMVDLETWETYIAALDSGSLMQCARVLSIDVSTASRRLKKLEEYLHMQLFYRDSSGVFPTVAGQALLEQVRPVIRQINALRSNLASTNLRLKGNYLVLLEPEFFCEALRNVFDSLEFSNSGLNFSYMIGSVSDNEFSAATVLQVSLGTAARADWINVGSLPVVCAASRRYLEMKGILQTPEEIPGHNVISWGRKADNGRAVFSRQDMTMSIPYKAAEVYPKASLALLAATHDEGIAIGVPAVLAVPYLASGKLKRVLEDWVMPDLDVNVRIFEKDQENSVQTAFLLEELTNAFAKTMRFDFGKSDGKKRYSDQNKTSY